MSGTSEIVMPIPQLHTWAEQHMASLYKDVHDQTFTEDFASTFTDDAQIAVNGKTLSCDQYKEFLKKEKFLEKDAQVAFTGAVQVPADPQKPMDVSVAS